MNNIPEDKIEEVVSDSCAEATPGEKKAGEETALPVASEKKTGILKILGIVSAIVLVCVYLAVAVWFMFHYNYRTYINGTDYSFYSLDEVDADIAEYIEGYKLTIKARGGEEYDIMPEQIDLQLEPSTDAHKMHKLQNSFLWIYYIFVDKSYDVTYTASYSESRLASLLRSFDFTSMSEMEKPEDAYVTVQDGKAVIISEKEGNYVDFTKLYAIINKALVDGVSVIDVDSEGAYAEPGIRQDDETLADMRDKLEELLDMTITYCMDEVTWELTCDEYGGWLSYKDEEWVFSDASIRKYVESIAEKYNTYGTERSFKTHDGDTITVEGKRYGWLINEEEEFSALKELLEKGKSAEHVPCLEHEGTVYTDDGDIGDTYVECDMGEQRVYVYVDGKLVIETACVTGSVAAGRATPEGLYTIKSKSSPAILVGADYRTPVTFWIPFNGGIGLHDATWRSSFGGSIYVNSGSHGCVNLPYAAAKELYSVVYAGMPVICYY